MRYLNDLEYFKKSTKIYIRVFASSFLVVYIFGFVRLALRYADTFDNVKNNNITKRDSC